MSTTTEPLRIGLVSLHTSPGDEPGSGEVGGMNVVVRHQAEALADRGHHVEIITRRSDPTQPDSVSLVPGVCLRFLSAGPAQPVPKGEHDAFIEPFRRGLEALGPYDVLHSHHWFSGAAALPVARERGVPHVQSFHSIAADSDTPLSEGERPSRPAARRRAGCWRRSPTRSSWSRRPRRRPSGTASAAATTGSGSSRRASTGPSSDRGRRRASRRLAVRRRRGARAAAEGPGPRHRGGRGHQPGGTPTLVIAGDASSEAGDHVAELRRLAAAHGIADRVTFIGPQSRADLAFLFRGAAAVLVPSHSETYGLVALEGSASGVPVVAAAAGGLREAVVDGETGVVLESRDPAVWAAEIERILTDTDYAAGLAAAGREHAERLSWEQSAAGLEDVYRRVLGRA